MSTDSMNDLVFYCPQHQLRFRAAGEAVVSCEQGGHPVGYGFPEKSWWEYCCDCATFWPSQLSNGYLRRSECLVCERPTAKRYICSACQVVSIESATLVRRKLYSITSESGISPSCPGCAKHADGTPSEHQCGEIAASILTSRSTCPFCETAIRAGGSPQSRTQPPRVCPFCGTRAKAGIKFCKRCGKPQPQTSKNDATNEAHENLTGPTNQLSASTGTRSQSDIPIQPKLLSSQIVPIAEEAEKNTSGVDGTKVEPEIELTSSELPRWEARLPAAPPKRRVRLIRAAIAVAITVVVVLTIAMILSGRRSASKSGAPNLPPTAPVGMVYVPGGEFTMGNDTGDEYERPAHRVTVKPFFIDVNEVTCEQYSEFVKATGHKLPVGWKLTFPQGAGRQPVTGVDWYDANDYAHWANKRLPIEDEWEFAARGTDGRIYPWGNEWRSNAANAGDSNAGQFTNVGSYPEGKSPFGVMDMIGNAWEWTSSELRLYPGSQISHPSSGERKIIRGASWVKDNPPDWTATYRGFALPSGGKDYSKVGFRCAEDAASVQKAK
jgi:formylglycine-generating enzyme required for sulfatase activity